MLFVINTASDVKKKEMLVEYMKETVSARAAHLNSKVSIPMLDEPKKPSEIPNPDSVPELPQPSPSPNGPLEIPDPDLTPEIPEGDTD